MKTKILLLSFAFLSVFFFVNKKAIAFSNYTQPYDFGYIKTEGCALFPHGACNDYYDGINPAVDIFSTAGAGTSGQLGFYASTTPIIANATGTPVVSITLTFTKGNTDAIPPGHLHYNCVQDATTKSSTSLNQATASDFATSTATNFTFSFAPGTCDIGRQIDRFTTNFNDGPTDYAVQV